MYILNNNRVPMSLLNLSLSSLYQNKLNSALNPTKHVVPKTLSQQAPPCYLLHLNSYDLSVERHTRCFCSGYYISSHIFWLVKLVKYIYLLNIFIIIIIIIIIIMQKFHICCIYLSVLNIILIIYLSLPFIILCKVQEKIL